MSVRVAGESSARLAAEQVHEVPGALIGGEERDDDLPAVAAFLAFETLAHQAQREMIPKMRA